MNNLLFSYPVLSFPDMKQLFESETDASDYVLGTILTQHRHLVAYHSEKIFDTFWKYAIYYKEIYSIVQSYHQWKHYIMGKETIIHTDHKPFAIHTNIGEIAERPPSEVIHLPITVQSQH
jgi:hypothetical protein